MALCLALFYLGLASNYASAQYGQTSPYTPVPRSPLPTSYLPATVPPPGLLPVQVLKPPQIDAPVELQEPKKKEGPAELTYPHKDVLPAAYQQQRKSDEDQEFYMPIELPGVNRLTRRESESQWKERMRQEGKALGERRIFFPEPIVLSHEPVAPRKFGPMVCQVEPSYVVHDRLLFEQKNLERYMWDLGVLTPVANLVGFGYDMFLLPYHIWSRPADQMDTSAGKYLPGDNVPLLLYPESFSLTGLAGMAGTYLAGPFIFR